MYLRSISGLYVGYRDGVRYGTYLYLYLYLEKSVYLYLYLYLLFWRSPYLYLYLYLLFLGVRYLYLYLYLDKVPDLNKQVQHRLYSQVSSRC